MSAAAAAGCPLSNCCLWSKLCSPQIPHVDPGREYACMPADADDSPAQSVLVGILATSGGDRSLSLRLYRFRVAGSRRVIGDALETLGDGYYRPKTPTSHIRAASATVESSDGRRLSLCFFSREADFSDPKDYKLAPPIPLQLQMDLGAADDKGITVSRLPDLPPEVGPLMPTCPISAAGDLWAPYLTGVYGTSSLVMQRFDRDAARWVKVKTLALKRPPLGADMHSDGIPALQGHVVIGDTILLSLWPFHLFYTFDCSTRAWAAVATIEQRGEGFAPIRERGVYVEEDDTIYFLCDHIVYAYKLRKDQDRYQMAPPTFIGRVCPLFNHEGYGFLSYIGGGVMCSVWIAVKLPCDCDAKHVLITTFRVKGDGSDSEHFVPKGVKVLHSTCRRLDMAPSKSPESYLEFSFLQEYKDFNHENATAPAKRRRGHVMESSMLLEDMEVPASFNVVKSSNMHACCREVLNKMPLSCTVMLEKSDIRMNKNLYIIYQVASHSTVYKINILDGRLTCHDKTLKPHCILETSMCDIEDVILDRLIPKSWHFVCDSKSIYAAPSVENKVYSCSLDQGNINHVDSTRPVGVKFSLVVLVGINVVAISGTLQDVYHLSQGKDKWMCHKTSGPPDLDKEFCLSGYVVLSSSTFMVSDANENRCFLHDIVNGKWTIVNRLKPSSWPVRALLSGRCVFAKGFIYTCSDWGLAAFELVEQGGSYYLGELVDLRFSWNCWNRPRMCLEYVGEDTSSGAIMFCVAKDGQICQPGYPENEIPLRITTVQVKTEEIPDGKMKPKSIGHVDIGTSFVQWTGDDHICQPGYPENESPIRITTVQVKTEEMPDGKLKPKSIGHVDIGTAFVQGTGRAIWTQDFFAAPDIQA